MPEVIQTFKAFIKLFGFTNPAKAFAAFLLGIFPNTLYEAAPLNVFFREAPHDIRLLVSESSFLCQIYEVVFHAMGYVFARAVRHLNKVLGKPERDEDVFTWVNGKRVLKNKVIIVGWDGRAVSKPAYESFKRGNVAAGAEVWDVGITTGPALLQLSHETGYAAAHITASHYAWFYTGIKLTLPGGKPLVGDYSLRNILVRAERDEFGDTILLNGGGMITKDFDINKWYAAKVREGFDITKFKPAKIAFETFGLSATQETYNCFEGSNVELVNTENVQVTLDYDPGVYSRFRFPVAGDYRAPDPMQRRELNKLRLVIRQQNCDMGIARDGDGDRVFFLDKTGRVIPADIIFCIVIKRFLKKFPGSKILYDVRASKIVRETILKYGGVPVLSRVGHAFIINRMQEEGIDLGGEFSGHYYLKHGEAPWFVTYMVMEELSEENVTLEQAAAPFEKYFHCDEITGIRSAKNDRFEECKGNAPAFFEGWAQARGLEMKSPSYADGITLDFGTCWLNLRGSYTEPVVRFVAESRISREDLVVLAQAAIEYLEKYGIKINITMFSNNYPELIRKISDPVTYNRLADILID